MTPEIDQLIILLVNGRDATKFEPSHRRLIAEAYEREAARLAPKLDITIADSGTAAATATRYRGQ